jgi:DNA-binding response OmpR family regulator
VTSKVEGDGKLRGAKILVVDDEFLIAVHIETILNDAGAETTSATTLQEALIRAENTMLSAAVLDFRLGGDTSEPIADVLAARNVPFVFYSGQTLPDKVRAKYPGVIALAKPLRHNDVVEAVRSLIER